MDGSLMSCWNLRISVSDGGGTGWTLLGMQTAKVISATPCGLMHGSIASG
jgi:hypothetical protein